MTQDPTQVRIAPNGHLYVAPLATTIPTTVTAAWAAGWIELGYADDSGVVLTPSLETTDIRAWQTAVPVKTVPTTAKFDVKFALLQYNKGATELFFGSGATWAETSVGSGIYKLTLPSSPVIDERMLGVEWTDGTITNRLVISRGMVSARDNVELTRGGAIKFGVTFTAMDASGELARLLTDMVMT